MTRSLSDTASGRLSFDDCMQLAPVGLAPVHSTETAKERGWTPAPSPVPPRSWYVPVFHTLDIQPSRFRLL